MISLFWLVIHAHGIKGHGQVDIFTIKQTLLDEVNAGKILPNPTLKLNHSSQNFWIWMLFLSFSFLHTKIQAPDFLQNQLAFRFQTRTFMSLPSEPLMILCYQPSLPALDNFPSCSASSADLTGPLNNLLTYLNTCIYIGGFILYMC